MLDMSDDDATRMLATFKISRHVRMVWRVADMSATSHGCRARGISRTTRQTNKRAALRDTRDIVVTCYEDVTRMSRVRQNATRMLRENCKQHLYRFSRFCTNHSAVVTIHPVEFELYCIGLSYGPCCTKWVYLNVFFPVGQKHQPFSYWSNALFHCPMSHSNILG